MDMSIGISSIENNVLQSFFVFFRMVITNRIICNIKITIYAISKNSAITISSVNFKFVSRLNTPAYWKLSISLSLPYLPDKIQDIHIQDIQKHEPYLNYLWIFQVLWF